jgi:tetratricopeptide (TPR) repeat protein
VDDLAVRASVAPSYRALDGRARRAFRRLSLVGPQDVAEWVVAALLDEPDAADVVNLLADKSLLTLAGVDAGGEPRYRLHDLLRDFAAERLAEDPEQQRDAALERMLTGYLQLAGLADRGLPREPTFPPPQRLPAPAVVPDTAAARLTADPVAWFAAERLNLLAATRRACEPGRGQHELAARLASCQLAFQNYQARFDDAGAGCCQQALATARQFADPVCEYLALSALAKSRSLAGDHTDATDLAQQALKLMRGIGYSWGEARCLTLLGSAYHGLGRHRDAIDALARALPVYQRCGARHAQAACLLKLGHAHQALGHHQQATQYLQHSLRISRELRLNRLEQQALQALQKCRAATGPAPGSTNARPYTGGEACQPR